MSDPVKNARYYNFGFASARHDEAAARRVLDLAPKDIDAPLWWMQAGIKDALAAHAPVQFAARPPVAHTQPGYTDGFAFALTDPPAAQIDYRFNPSPPTEFLKNRHQGILDGLYHLTTLDQERPPDLPIGGTSTGPGHF